MEVADPTPLAATRRLLAATSSVAGAAFHRNLVAAVAAVLGVRYARLGQVVPGGRIATRAMWDAGRFVADVSYDLDGSADADVLAAGTCHVASGAAERYPRDTTLAALGATSYTGLRLDGSAGRPIGVLAALHDHPTAADP